MNGDEEEPHVPNSKPEKTRTDDSDSDVGYGRPPRQHQFKPGQSGNQKGRPKGSKSEDQMLEELLSRKIATREGDRLRKITLREVIYHGIAEEAVKKRNLKAAAFLFDRSALAKLAQPEKRELTEDDKTVLKAYLKKLSPTTNNEDVNDD